MRSAVVSPSQLSCLSLLVECHFGFGLLRISLMHLRPEKAESEVGCVVEGGRMIPGGIQSFRNLHRDGSAWVEGTRLGIYGKPQDSSINILNIIKVLILIIHILLCYARLSCIRSVLKSRFKII